MINSRVETTSPLNTISRCTAKSGDTNLNTGQQYLDCLKKVDSRAFEDIRKGANAVTGSKESLTGPILNKDLKEGYTMATFKTRILEEGFQDSFDKITSSGKEFVKRNPYIGMGLGGAAAGAAMNYFGHGAEDLKADREADVSKWLSSDAKDELTKNGSVGYDRFSEYRDHLLYGADKANPLLGAQNTEDFYLATNNPENLANLQRLHNLDPRLGQGTTDADFTQGGTSVVKEPIGDVVKNHYSKLDKIDGYQINPNVGPELDHSNYLAQRGANFRGMSNDEVRTEVGKDSELASTLAGKDADVKTAGRDSYLRKALGGAALGAGGLFAKRKIDERRNREF